MRSKLSNYAAVSSNTLNEVTLLRATKALFNYLKNWMQAEGILEHPRLVVANDVRAIFPQICSTRFEILD